MFYYQANENKQAKFITDCLCYAFTSRQTEPANTIVIIMVESADNPGDMIGGIIESNEDFKAYFSFLYSEGM